MSQDPHPPHTVEEIEAAMLRHARLAAQAGVRGEAATGIDHSKPLATIADRLIANPAFAYLEAEATLIRYLTIVHGIEASRAALARVSAVIFEEYDRPAIAAAGGPQ